MRWRSHTARMRIETSRQLHSGRRASLKGDVNGDGCTRETPKRRWLESHRFGSVELDAQLACAPAWEA